MTEKEHSKKDILPIDYPALLKRLAGDESFLKELLGMYFEDFPKKYAELQKAVEEQNFDLIFKLGHSLKGSSANLSMPHLREASSQMETAGRDESIENAKKALITLEQEFKRLKDFFAEKKGQINPDVQEKSDLEDSSPKLGSEKSQEVQVLAADDSIDNQRLLKVFATHTGIELDIASNGKEALALFQKKKYSLVFLDIHMPEIDGFETLNEIRSLEKETSLSPTPIIALTGSSFPEDRERSLSLGFDDYVEKPLEKNEFFKIVNKYLGTSYHTSSPEVVHIDQSIKDLVPGYLKHRKNDIQKMKDALKESDFSTIESIAHKIKGSGESYGFKKAGQIGKEIEKSAQEENLEKIDRLLEEFESYLDNIQYE
jgi:CheY-like chemotaxis protein